MSDKKLTTSLHDYVSLDENFFATYEDYQADEELIARIHALRPTAHVITPCRYTCGDCARNVPRMARIAESLPGWTWEVFSSEDTARREALDIRRIPTFIVYDPSGKELGRIVENPQSGSLEKDLLAIVSENDQAV